MRENSKQFPMQAVASTRPLFVILSVTLFNYFEARCNRESPLLHCVLCLPLILFVYINLV